MQKSIVLILLCFAAQLWAQEAQPPFTPADERLTSQEQRQSLQEKSLFNGLKFKSVGPSVFSGRVADLDVSPVDPTHFYAAYASGGLWKTENNGVTFRPLFDQEVVMTIGDIAVDWNNNTIWLGSGEVNSSRSSYAGAGIFKSTDEGKTWQHLGLAETHHIGRVVLHPGDPNTAWVAALGHLYSPNEDRGVYKTTDGGASWQKTLYVNPNAGAVDLLIDPADPNVLYAATWQRERRAWDFIESGEGSGIYKSTDGGNTWTLITTPESSFPVGEGGGRIGLALTKRDGKSVLYAAIDNYNRRPEEEPEENVLTRDMLRVANKEALLGMDAYLVKDYLRSNNFPEKYSYEQVIEMIKKDEITPLALVEYVEDANSLLINSPVIGLEVYQTEDDGKTWNRTHADYIDDLYNSYGYYFGQIRVAPQDPNKIYLMGVPIIRSDDGGKTFKSIHGDNVHADHHALWVNPNRAGHLILGNDGGVNISYDDGESWNKANYPPVGQFYYAAVDMAEPYNIYGGLQDNGVWMGPHTYEAGSEWQSTGQYPFKEIMGGDGMQVAVDTRDNETVYTGFQFGNYFRLNTRSGSRKSITPKPELGERPLRWNWQTPIHLSAHNQDILYMGSNKVHRSFDQGDSFAEISGDLTTGGRKGDVAFSTLTAIHESPLKFGLLYTGSDDGLVHVSQDGGNNWTNIGEGLPEQMWVARIQASKYAEGRVYVALNGYRWDDFRPMLYVSEDYGLTWKSLAAGLPVEPINVVKEDPENENILYVGTDHGLYVSLDRGESFMTLHAELPAAPVHDVVVHPRDKELIVATHGRSFFLAPVKELQQLNEELLGKSFHLFALEKVRYRPRWGNESWFSDDQPEVSIPIFLQEAGPVKVTVQTDAGLVLRSFEQEGLRGLNYLSYDLTIDEKKLADYNKFLNKETKKGEKPVKVKPAENGKTYIYKGNYELILSVRGKELKETLSIE